MGAQHILHHYLLVVFCAVLISFLSFLLQITVRYGHFSRYTVNFVYDTICTALTGAVCLFTRTGFGLDSWRLLLGNALCMWFYQWGSLKALEALPLGIVSGLNSSLNPVIAGALSAWLLSETPTCWFGVVLARNVLVIWLILGPLFSGKVAQHDEAKSAGVTLGSTAWVFVMASSAAFSMTLQRSMRNKSPALIALWGFAVNAILWLPPGAWPDIRAPYLWPLTENDHAKVYVPAYAWLASAGAFGAAANMMIAQTLQRVDVPSFVIVLNPTLISMNCILDILEGTHIAALTFAGLLVATAGVVLDTVLGKALTKKAGAEEDQSEFASESSISS